MGIANETELALETIFHEMGAAFTAPLVMSAPSVTEEKTNANCRRISDSLIEILR